ncbi:cytidylate kinase [Natranaerovirga pectinivora]|uniref:Cytidylate kinase n=1 Tax=Natranaerovirga pectinivora TaxID=682400 RepID=A0A4R3MPT9_9FIRM|nr:(d)CMP kinase [Natranaerovirga pectinivora]TCT15002.1 cytidylate kinase [Natranaerovirga pectinivora]
MKLYKSIAIDGPAGAGKSTIAKKIANKLNYTYIDTGAMYRAMGLEFCRLKIDLNDENTIYNTCSNIDIKIQYINGEQQVILNGENVNSLIRTSEAGQMASVISIYKPVRLKLVELQRKLSEEGNVIMDGRDIGTYVLPNADLKIYLTASIFERAKRRWTELLEKGEDIDLKRVESEIEARDNKDMNREIAPLRKAEDAVVVDTSDLTIDEVVEKIISIYTKRIELD